MGGIGSGRSGGRPTVEGSITLDLAALRRGGAIRPGHVVRFSTDWTRAPGQLAARASIEVSMREDAGEIRIKTLTLFDPIGRQKTVETGQVIRLEAVPAPLSGVRWWLVCPLSGRRVLKLHCPGGRFLFGSRTYYRLGYACQRETTRDRAFRRARRARRRIGGTDNLAQPLPGKPKWMRWPTYARFTAMEDRAHRVVIEQTARLLEQFQQRFQRAAWRQASP